MHGSQRYLEDFRLPQPFQAMSVLLNACTIWTLMKRLKKKLDGNYTRILRAVLNKFRKQLCTATYLPSRKPSKKDDQDMLGTAAEERIHKRGFLMGLKRMDTPVLAD